MNTTAKQSFESFYRNLIDFTFFFLLHPVLRQTCDLKQIFIKRFPFKIDREHVRFFIKSIFSILNHIRSRKRDFTTRKTKTIRKNSSPELTRIA